MKSVGLVKESAVLVIFAFFSGALTAAPAFGMPVHESVNAEENRRSVHEDSVAKDLQEFEVVSERVRKEVISTAPLFTMSEERMKVMGVTDISDALHRLPGVNIRDYGGAGGMKTVSVRGFGTTHTGVIYDGIVLSDCQSGKSIYQGIPLTMWGAFP